MDWTPIATAITAGVSAVAGATVGSWLTGRSQLNALWLNLNEENRRARLADKRRIYARYVAAVDKLVVTAGSDSPDSEMKIDLQEMFAALSELRLTGALILGELGENTARTFMRSLGEEDANGEYVVQFREYRNKLYEEMRADPDIRQLNDSDAEKPKE